jgi:hypothetical protein
MLKLVDKSKKTNGSQEILRPCETMQVKKFDPPPNPNYYPGLLRLMRMQTEK